MNSRPILTLEPKVLAVRDLTAGAYVLRIERNGIPFVPGQNVSLGLRRMRINREYSICSGLDEPWLDFLIREIEGGTLSPALRRCRPGDTLDLCGPYGTFVLERPDDLARPLLFVATGTGLAPYRSIVRSHPGLDYRIVHGIRDPAERSEPGEFAPGRYIACVSRAPGGDFPGRVTGWLREAPLAPSTLCYLCGNSRMIAEAYDILRTRGIPADAIVTEAFF